MSEPDSLLAVEGLTVVYRQPHAPAVLALSEVGFALNRGEAVGVLGESGSGKTTIGLAIMRLLPPSALVSGRIRLAGVDLLGRSDSEMRRIRGARISLVQQEPVMALHPLRRAGDQLVDVVRAHRTGTKTESRRQARELLASVGFTDVDRAFASYPHELSGGQRQRVVIAQALACEPELVIMDEPFAALDHVSQADLLALIRSLRQRLPTALLFITHDSAVLSGLVDRVLVMSAGHLVETAPADEICAARHQFTPALRMASPGRRDCAVARAATADGQTVDPLLRIDKLTRIYSVRRVFGCARRVVAVRDVSLTLHRGAALGVVGRSGSGKSTLARCVALLDRPCAGRVCLAGRELTGLSGAARRAARRAVQLVFQEPACALNPRLTIEEIVTEPLAIERRLSGRSRRAHVEALLARVTLPADCLTRHPRELSGGQRQRLAIARALAANPQVLILDEALAGLDLTTQAQLVALLQRLRAESAVALICITHDLRLAAQLTDDIVVMADGCIVERHAAADMFDAAEHPRTRELVGAVPRGPSRSYGRAVA